MDTEPLLLELFFELKEIHNTWLNFFNTKNIQIELKQNFGDYIVLILPSIIAITAIIYSHKNIKTQAIMTIKKDRIVKFEENISNFLTTTSVMNDAYEAGLSNLSFIKTIRKEIENQNLSKKTKEEKQKLLYEAEENDKYHHRRFETKKEQTDLLTTRIKMFLNDKCEVHSELINSLQEWSLLSFAFSEQVKNGEDASAHTEKIQYLKNQITQRAKTVIEYEYNNLS